MRRLLVVALVLVSPARAEAAWAPPVSGPPARLFDLGPDPFAAGAHRGVDLAAARGEPVRAACSGIVRFAGPVAGTRTVSVTCGRWRVSYAPLERIAVREGDRVLAGEPLGRVAPGRLGHAPRPRSGTSRGFMHAGGARGRSGHAGLHLGVRREGRQFGYVDPLRFLSGSRRAPPPVVPVRATRRAPRPHPAPHAARPSPALAPWPVWLGLALLMTGLAGAGRLRLPVKQTGGAACRASSTSSSSPTTPSRP